MCWQKAGMFRVQRTRSSISSEVQVRQGLCLGVCCQVGLQEVLAEHGIVWRVEKWHVLEGKWWLKWSLNTAWSWWEDEGDFWVCTREAVLAGDAENRKTMPSQEHTGAGATQLNIGTEQKHTYWQSIYNKTNPPQKKKLFQYSIAVNTLTFLNCRARQNWTKDSRECARPLRSRLNISIVTLNQVTHNLPLILWQVVHLTHFELTQVVQPDVSSSCTK